MASFRFLPERGQANGFRLLSIFGIPVHVEVGFLIFLAIIWYIYSGSATPPQIGLLCFIIFFSILFHELGHALASVWAKCDNIRITLVAFGGYATHSPTTRGKSLIIVLAGPAFSFILAGLGYLLLHSEGLMQLGPADAMPFVLVQLWSLNLLWGIFNLLPIHPLDGGQALFHFLTYGLDQDRAMLWVIRVSMVLCVVVGGYAFMHGQQMLAIFCFLFFYQNFRIAMALGHFG